MPCSHRGSCAAKVAPEWNGAAADGAAMFQQNPLVLSRGLLCDGIKGLIVEDAAVLQDLDKRRPLVPSRSL